jgi:hypothetical protein
MSMHKRKFFAALAVAGVVAAGGSAFTAGGLQNLAGADQFVGGSVTQTVSGTTVTGVAYETDAANNNIKSVTLTFGNDAADGTQPTLVFSGPGAENYTCAIVAEVVDAKGTSVCGPAVTGVFAKNTVIDTKITVTGTKITAP